MHAHYGRRAHGPRPPKIGKSRNVLVVAHLRNWGAKPRGSDCDLRDVESLECGPVKDDGFMADEEEDGKIPLNEEIECPLTLRTGPGPMDAHEIENGARE